ncbi:MAG: hypothetical protein ABSG63_09380 [Spirochaetia bacterium]
MTPEEELKRLNRLVRQYEIVFKTTPDPDQRERVEAKLKDLRDYRAKILAVNVINGSDLEEKGAGEDELAEFPILRRLVAANDALPPGRRAAPFSPRDVPPTAAQKEMHHLSLFMSYFEREYLPFLTEKQLKLDFKFSLDRDAFYSRFQDLQRKIENFRQENARIADGSVSRDRDLEVRKRANKLTRLTQADAAKFFRAVKRFSGELGEDASGDGVKCLNCDAEISFDPIEGERVLQGRTVRDALGELEQFALEAVSYLNIPDMESQESERADRH